MKLHFSEVAIRKGTFTLTANIGFSPGIHLITGRIGSGKSTLAHAAAGTLTPESGTIERSGTVALLMQFPEYHVTEATISGEISSWGVSGTEPSFSLLKTEKSRDPLTLSRGELRRLELACILAKNPDILILDEPYASLDRSIKPVLRDLLEKRTGITLLISHEEEFLPQTINRWRVANGTVTHE